MLKTFLVLLTLWCSMLSATDFIIPTSHFEDENVQYHFIELLKSLILMNEKRVDTMQKYTQLQTKNVAKNSLRISPDEESEKQIIIVLTPTIPRDSEFKGETRSDLSTLIESLQRKGLSIEVQDTNIKDNAKSKTLIKTREGKDDDNDDSSDSSSDETEEDSGDKSKRSNENFNNTQLRYRDCGKKATKDCKRACKDAVRDGCSRYHCRSKLKKNIKKECKRSCKDRFK